jgi:hypothetical protein
MTAVYKDILSWAESKHPWIQDALIRLITQAEITDKGSENTHMVAVFNIRLVLLNWFIIPGEKVQSIMENFEKIGLW